MFTLANIAEELRSRVDFEVIAVDNWCRGVEQQGRTPDRAHKQLPEIAKGQPWLKVIKYDKKLSHWQAKNLGVGHARGEFLWFCDAHCIVSRDALYKMFVYYRTNWEAMEGTIHLPLTYLVLEWHKLIYKLNCKPDQGVYHYTFSGYRHADEPYQVPCMSTCGMMMHRSLFDQLGGWPTELGIYGGGENFLNFTLAVLGKKVWIMPGEPLRHHGEKRGYAWNATDHMRNRLIATYIFGGLKVSRRYLTAARGREHVKERIYQDILKKCAPHRSRIRKQQAMSIEDWFLGWQK